MNQRCSSSGAGSMLFSDQPLLQNGALTGNIGLLLGLHEGDLRLGLGLLKEEVVF
jgi:hypothetical protein